MTPKKKKQTEPRVERVRAPRPDRSAEWPWPEDEDDERSGMLAYVEATDGITGDKLVEELWAAGHYVLVSAMPDGVTVRLGSPATEFDAAAAAQVVDAHTPDSPIDEAP